MSRQPISIGELQAEAEQHLMAALSREVNDTFHQLASESENQPAPAHPELATLAAQVLRALRKDDGGQAIYHAVARHLADAGMQAKALLQLPRGLQVFYLSFMLELEVLNGGMHQFFWNSSDELACLIPVALRELGAQQAAQIVEQARLVASEEAVMADGSHTLAAFLRSSGDTSLSRFDPQLRVLVLQFPALRAAYLRAHPYLFLP